MKLQLNSNFNVLETGALYDINGGITRNDILAGVGEACYIGGFLALPLGPEASLTIWGAGCCAIDGIN